MRSGVPTAPSRTRILARVSSHIFLMSSPFRPMMLPTFNTGTMSLNTQSPGHPGHLLSAAVEASPDSVGGTGSDDSELRLSSASADGAVLFAVAAPAVASEGRKCESDSRAFGTPFPVGSLVAMAEIVKKGRIRETRRDRDRDKDRGARVK